uniref:Polyketide synthase modules-related protein n=1 Tax=Gynuella sunshinyii TaxID=1445505 RepID=UPI0024C473A0|nr:Chain A, Polyketide synthase modules-related protein [Gynuella sunshinyii]8ODW_B Chain B, Polyketide synthase modules-related protein [Gynuella sunshinyii]
GPGSMTDQTRTKKRICIIGAGPAGLVMAKSLLEEGHEPVIYETESVLGGIWNIKADKTAGVYNSTRFQNSADTSFFSDFPADTTDGFFLGVDQVRAYLQAYASRFDIHQYIHYNSKIIAVTEHGDQWKVDIGEGDQQQTRYFDGVAMCHGRYKHPFIPTIPGLDQFQGEVLHSGQYYDNRIFAGKRVLVIGNGVSGMDIAEEASHVASAVFWSMRSLRLVLPRMVGYLPNDFISPANLLISKDNSIIMERLKNSMPEYYECYQKSGLFPSLEDFRANPFVHINDGVIQRVAEGAIQTHVEDIERFTGRGCIFSASGTHIENIDMVVLCTGYDNSQSFDYVKQFSMRDDFAMGLFYRQNPSLVNTYGLQNVGTTGTLPYLEMVARWYAQIISGNYTLDAEELNHRAGEGEIVVAPLANVIMGLKLGLLPDPKTEFQAFWRCLNYPSFPPMYRLRGPHADPQAQSVLSRSVQRSLIQQGEHDSQLQTVKHRLLAGLGEEVMQALLARQEISQEEYLQAQRCGENAIVLSWDTQVIRPVKKASSAVSQQASVPADRLAEEAFQQRITELMSQTLKLDVGQITADRHLSDYGFSSVTLTAFSRKITDEYNIRLQPFVFLEYTTLKALTDFLYRKWSEQQPART